MFDLSAYMYIDCSAHAIKLMSVLNTVTRQTIRNREINIV